jgi:outer membrane protein TolC
MISLLRFARPLGALFLLFTTAVSAQDFSPTLSLETATQQALAHTPLLRARQAQRDAAREDAGRAGALPDPQLTVGIDNLAVQGPGAFTAGGDSMTMRTVGITQVLPSRAKRQAQRALAHAGVDEADENTKMTRLAIERQVADAWIAAWGAHGEAQSLKALRDAWAVDIGVAEARLRSGAGSAVAVLAIRTQSLDLENRIDDVDAREVQARATLARWMGRPVTEPLVQAPDFANPPHDEASLLASLDRQGDLLDWPSRERAAEAALAVAQAEKHPEWNVGVAYGSRVRGLSDMVSLQVGVSLPLFTRNRQDRGIAARAADLDAVRAEREDAQQEQKAAVQTAWAQWNALGKQVRRHRDAILPQAEDRVTLALAAFRGGGDLQPLLDARRDELAHHVDFARMLTDYGRAWASLAYLLPEGDTP